MKKLKIATRCSKHPSSNRGSRNINRTILPGLLINPKESYGDKHKNISLITNEMDKTLTKELDESLLNKERDI